jgi:opacity protein-like surface antigen
MPTSDMRRVLALLTCSFGLSVTAYASDHQQSGWKNYVTLYGLGAGLDGDVTVRGIDAELDASFSDILENLDFGAMVAYRGETEAWYLSLDAIYMGLGASKSKGGVSADADFDEFVLEADVGLRIDPQFEAFVGARLWSLDAQLEVTGPGPGQSGQADQSWVDPLVGARYIQPIGDAWSFVLRGDVGGFGVGSEFSWQGIARVNWQCSESLALNAGYRYVDVDYEDGSGSDEFRYDVATSGPMVGLTFGF